MATLFGKRKRRRQAETTENDPTKADENELSESNPTFSESAPLPNWASLDDLGLAEPLVTTCRQMGFKKPTPVQRTVIPFILNNPQAHILALAQTGSGKTAAFVLPILHRLAPDPYGIYAVILTPTRELAKQIHQQVLALGSAYNVQSALVVGGLDSVRQSLALDKRPHFCVATPGRLAELLKGPKPPVLQHVRFMVLDEADRLLTPGSGFERDVAELLINCTTTTTTEMQQPDNENDELVPMQRKRREKCQTLLFSATMTRSLESVEAVAGGGLGRLPLKKFVVRENDGDESNANNKKKKKMEEGEEDGDEDAASGAEEESDEDDANRNTPKIPAGLKQEYVFMPARVRDAYVVTAIRHLLVNGGRRERAESLNGRKQGKDPVLQEDEQSENQKSKSAVVFVSTCERAALVSGILTQLGVDNVALHSLLSQNRRLASLGKFKSQQVRVLVATDIAARGLDIPSVDLVLNSELPRNPLSYVHRVGRTARAGRRGLAISFVSDAEIGLVHACERLAGRPMEKSTEVTDDKAIKLLGPVTKATRLTKLKLNEIGFDELVQKFKERKERDRKERNRIQRALKKMEKKKKKA